MSDIITLAKEYVFNFFAENYTNSFTYHDYTHTFRVVEKAKEIGLAEGADAHEMEILELAAWFQDTAFYRNPTQHEDVSIQIAGDFLSKHNIDTKEIDAILSCIAATKPGVKPDNLLEMILKDANAFHLAEDNYEDSLKLMREELKLLDIKTYSDVEWVDENIQRLKHSYRYYTSYAIKKWQTKKSLHLVNLNEQKLKLNQKKKKKSTKELATRSERSIDTLFRITLKNHTSLSDTADRKANILLSVNAIIISVALSNLIPKLDNPSNKYLIYPTVIFIFFSVVSMILSIVATRPHITTGTFTREEVINKKVNIVFFGKFHKMKLEEFEWAMNEVMNDKQYLYSSLAKDLYALGTVLARKYSILRYTYVFFMTGIIISTIAFGIAFKLGR
ncbi:MAG: Pycsar system effector family protein [Leeuwenhoekiella sp.]